MKHGSLFSGIGGFDLAAQRMGWTNVFQVEIDHFCQNVLQKNFPDAERHADIKSFDASQYAGQLDIISGGFPCQPFSVAGKRKGASDDRALWVEMLRVIRTIRPTWVVGENVAGIISMELDAVLSDLEGIGYACQAFVIPACAINALHRRDRVWIVAKNADGVRCDKPKREKQSSAGQFRQSCAGNEQRLCVEQATSDAERSGRQNWGHGKKSEKKRTPNEFRNNAWRCFESLEWQPNDTSDLLRTAYGIPGRVDGRSARIKALGNAIVPQVAYQIFKAIEANDILRH